MSKLKNYRHGDIDLIGITKEEYEEKLQRSHKDATKEGLSEYVVALGEATGHRHMLTMDRPKSLVVTKLSEDEVLFAMEAPGKIAHEEHHAFPMDTGFYVRKIEQEYDPFKDMARRALD